MTDCEIDGRILGLAYFLLGSQIPRDRELDNNEALLLVRNSVAIARAIAALYPAALVTAPTCTDA